jgi:subtilisin family serine protease
MKKRFFLKVFFTGVALFLISVGAVGAGVGEREGLKDATYVPGEILVRWKDWVDEFSIQRVHSRKGARVVGTFYATYEKKETIQRLRIRDGQTVEEALWEYRRDPLVEYAQPNYIYRIRIIPDDTRFGELWGLHNTGQTVGGVTGTIDADIDAPEAWGITTGSPGIIVAVVDTGVNYNHPELSGNMWINTGETPGNGIDDDRNGFIDDIRGWDFFDNDNDPMDFDSHGTHVAGTIAARGNNAEGITGVMWNARIMALKIAGVEAFAATSDIVSAINYAAANGARIINASWGRLAAPGETEDLRSILRGAIEAAGARGVLFVAAAGNEANNNDVRLSFPGGYTLPNIISVAATDQNDGLATFSNFGAASVDVAAPGVSVLSTIPILTLGTPVTLYDSLGFEGDALGALPSGWVSIANQVGIANTWAITSIYSFSPPNSFADSPGANYSNNLVPTATLTYLNTPVTHIRDSRYRFTFNIRYVLETNFDFLDAVASVDRATWRRIPRAELTGSSGGAFVSRSLNVTEPIELFRATGAFLGLGVRSNAIIIREGVYIDNLRLERVPILVTGHGYEYFPGTSMAAPHVAGLAGLLLSRNPTLTVAQLKGLIMDGADPRPGLSGRMVTGGRINAHNSLRLPSLSVTPASHDFGNVTVGTTADRNFTVTNTGGGTLTGSATVATPFSIVSGSPFNLGAGASASVTVRFSPTATGPASATVAFTSNGGNLTRSVSGTGIGPAGEYGCFIATTAYGTPLAEEVEVLRRLRDKHLLTNELGQRLVAFYYQHSPRVAEFIQDNEWTKPLARIALWPLVRVTEFIVGKE